MGDEIAQNEECFAGSEGMELHRMRKACFAASEGGKIAPNEECFGRSEGMNLHRIKRIFC